MTSRGLEAQPGAEAPSGDKRVSLLKNSEVKVAVDKEPKTEDDTKKIVLSDEAQTMASVKLYLKDKDTFRLLRLWLYIEAAFYLDVLILVCFLYYLDIALDMNAIYIFMMQKQYKYVAINLGAILLANMWTAFEMLSGVPITENDWITEAQIGGSILLVGYLIPSFLHIAFLAYVSLRIGKKHPLLLCAKLAESTLEASISSLVQVYALIFSEWVWHEFVQLSASVCSSFLSIGYAFACFDRRGLGLNGIPGLLPGWSLALILVYLFRCAEVASRISSIAIFSVATRKHLHLPAGELLPEPFDTWLRVSLTTAGPLLVALDMVVLLLLTLNYQWHNLSNVKFAIPSFLCFMNPLLEKGNPVTLPVYVYYGWRWFQLLFMGCLAYFLAGGIEELMHGFDDEQDYMILIFCVVTTVLWTFLLPIIRYAYASHTLMSYTLEMLSAKEFNRSQELLRDSILRSTPDITKQSDEFNCSQEILRDSISRSNPSQDQPDSSVGYGLIGQPQIETLGAELRKQSGEFLSNAVERLKEATASAQRTTKGSCDKKNAVADEEDKQGEDGGDAPGEARCTTIRLYEWGQRLVQEHEEKKRQQDQLQSILGSVLRLSANIIPFQPKPDEPWKSSVGKSMHYDVLTQIKAAIAVNSVKQVSLDNFSLITGKLLPTWSQWRDSDLDKKLYRHKCLIIKQLGKLGWESKNANFLADALKLHACLDALPKKELLGKMKLTTWESCCGPEQMKALVSLWHLTAADLKPGSLNKLFRPKVEICAMTEGAVSLLEKFKSDKKASSDVPADDLPSCCAALAEARDELQLVGPIAKETAALQSEVLELVNKAVEVTYLGFREAVASKDAESMQKRFKDLSELHQKLIKNDQYTRQPRYQWAPEVIKNCEEKLENAKSAKNELEEEVRKAKVEEARRKAEEDETREEEMAKALEDKRKAEEEAEEMRRRAEEEAQEREAEREDNKELEAMLEENVNQQRLQALAARRKQQRGKLREKELKRKLKHTKMQTSKGVVLAVTVTDDIDAFIEYAFDDEGDSFSDAVAQWCEVPRESISLEELLEDGTLNFQIDGSVVACIEMDSAVTGEAASAWAKLHTLMSEAKPLPACNLAARIVEIEAGQSFTVRFDGRVSDLLLDEEMRSNVLEELETQLNIDDESSTGPTALSMNEDSLTTSGTLTMFVYVAVSDVLKTKVRGSVDETNPLALPGITCSLSIPEEENLEDDGSDDQSSVGVGGITRSLSGISEGISEEDE